MAKQPKVVPMPKITSNEMTLAVRIVAGILAPIARMMFKVEVINLDKLPKSGAYILAPNHATNIDALAVAYFIYIKTKRAPHFLTKERLFSIPLVGKILLAAGQIPVFRTGGQRNDDSLRAAHAYLKAGHSVCVFPEGTLTRDPDSWPMRGKTGAIRLALDSGVPVYPVGQWGSEKILARYSSKFRPGFWKKVTVLVGDEIDLARFRKPNPTPAEVLEATEVVMSAITKLVEQLRGEKAPDRRWDPVAAGQATTGNFIKKAQVSGGGDV
jgi:1-acyl-sn-glycerol-3-phosphate acyltransferase